MRRFGAVVDGVTRLPTVTGSTSPSGSMSPRSGDGSARCARVKTGCSSSCPCSTASAPSKARLCQSGAGPDPGSPGQIPGTACCVGEGNDTDEAYTGR